MTLDGNGAEILTLPKYDLSFANILSQKYQVIILITTSLPAIRYSMRRKCLSERQTEQRLSVYFNGMALQTTMLCSL